MQKRPIQRSPAFRAKSKEAWQAAKAAAHLDPDTAENTTQPDADTADSDASAALQVSGLTTDAPHTLV